MNTQCRFLRQWRNHPLFRHCSKEEGATLIYVSLSLMVLLGFAGLALDGGYAFTQRGRMQVAADAAALAGARLAALDSSNSEISSQVKSVAYTNGATDVDWWLIKDGDAIRVDTSRTIETWFAKLFGLHAITLEATAEAEAFAFDGFTELLPLTTMCTDAGFSEGTVYTFWDLDMTEPGSFGWLDWNGSSAGNGELAANISNPDQSDFWHIGEWVSAGPSVRNSPAIRRAIRKWLGNPVTIPLYSDVSGSGRNATYRICGFAEFIITGYKFKGGDKWIQGMFVRNIKNGEEPGQDGVGLGVRNAVLLK